MSDVIKLIGIVIVIGGFALKKDSIMIIMLAAFVTALIGGLGLTGFFETLGTAFISNRSMNIFIIVMLITGTLERNGLRESAANFISKFKNVTSGAILGIYAVIRALFAGLANTSLGGAPGFLRPVVMPMAVGAVESKGVSANEDHVEEIKGMASGVENIGNFFFQVVFVGGSGALLVQSTLATYDIKVELIDLAAVEIPVALTALVVTIIYYNLLEKKNNAKFYGDKANKSKEAKK